MGLSWSHILIVLVLFVLLFGRGKISELMGDLAQGIKSFKKGMAEDDDGPRQGPQGHRARQARPQDGRPRQGAAQAEIGLDLVPSVCPGLTGHPGATVPSARPWIAGSSPAMT